MELVIITGLSGSGKSQTINAMEDVGFFCVDNLPPKLIFKFAEIGTASKGNLDRIAIVTDIRGGDLFSGLFEELALLEREDFKYKILFLDASEEALLRRFKETRRNVSWKIFNSDAQSWSKGDSRFSREIENKSKFIIVIKTTEGKKFGCYISSMIEEEGKYINDPNAFIFKIEKNQIEKYPIKDSTKAIKIFLSAFMFTPLT